MNLTKSQLKQIIKEEMEQVKEGGRFEWEPGYQGEGEDARAEWLVDRVGELFRRISELEKYLDLEWRDGA